MYLRDFVSSHQKLGLNWSGSYLVTRSRGHIKLFNQNGSEMPPKTVYIYINKLKNFLLDLHPPVWKLLDQEIEILNAHDPHDLAVLQEVS